MATRIGAESTAMREADPDLVDLNRAEAEDLMTLPGIGTALASRIVAYRDEHGPFLFAEDIKQVEGVGAGVYDAIADRLTVAMPREEDVAEGEPPSLSETYGRFAESMEDDVLVTPPPAPQVDEALAEQPEAGPLATEVPPPLPFESDAEASEAEPVEVTDIEVDEIEVGEAEITEAEAEEVSEPSQATDWEMEGVGLGEEPASTPGEMIAEPEAVEEPEEAPVAAPVGAATASSRGRRAWFWTGLVAAVLGGIFGLLLSMVVFAGINGSVDLGQTTAFNRLGGRLNELDTEVAAVQRDISTLQGDLSGLRERVEVLAGLTARMEQAEETLATFTKDIQGLQEGVQGIQQEVQGIQESTAALEQGLNTLNDSVDVMGQTLDAVEEQTERATTFFGRLQELLQDVFGAGQAEPESSLPTQPAGAAAQPEVDA